jgi:ribosome assembly protein 1
VSKIVQTLNLKILPRDLKSKDSRALLSLIFSQWLSLSTCIIQAAIDIVPPPSTAQLTRIPKILYPDLVEPTIEPKNKLERDLVTCNASLDAFVMVYVSKMFAVPVKELPENKKKPLTAEEMRSRAREAREGRTTETPGIEIDQTPQESEAPSPGPEEIQKEQEDVILGFARIYSGTIRVGTTIRCILPKYNNAFPSNHPRNISYMLTAMVEGLYTMMGRELVPVDSVPAGNVFAIKGLEGKVMRSATLCAPEAVGIGSGDQASDLSADCLLNLGGISRTVRS